MALNFPLNPGDQAVHVDPTSGLKYIYNTSIGGWETAIQPPVIITTDGTPPDISIDGFLWWDGQARILYVKRGGNWTAVSSDSISTATKVTVDSTPPDLPVQGDLWWDNVGCNLYIFYVDTNSQQWVIASPNVGGSDTSAIFTGPSAPPNAIEGELWYNTLDNNIYVYHLGQWVASSTAISGVDAVVGINPIFTTGTQTVTVQIEDADTQGKGAVRLANQAEVDSLSTNNVALTPNRLAQGIDNYLPQATEDRAGVMKLATATDAIQQTNSEKAITPATMSVALAASGNPPGTIIAYAGETAPAGYLVCNGDVILDTEAQTIQGITADFRALRLVVGTNYSSNDVDSLLPDLRGEFLRGWKADKSGVDAGRALGSFQNQSIQSHFHSAPAGPADVDVNGTTFGGGNRVTETGSYDTTATGDAETRPRNIAILYCIKY